MSTFTIPLFYKKIEKTSLKYPHLPPDLALWFTRSCSNYPCLIKISMIPKMFEPLKFDCIMKQPTKHCRCITKTCLFKYTENFTTQKWKFSDKNLIFAIFLLKNIDCGYSLEPPRRGGSNEYPQFLSRNKKNNVYPCKPQFNYKKWG